MELIRRDVAIIGAGTAGLAAREAAAENDASVVLIEAGPGGTTCASTGCMPSKLLIAAANAAEGTRRLGPFGLGLDGPVRVDGPAVMERVRRERDRFVAGVLRNVAEIPAADRLHGTARFLDRTTLQVGEDARVEARAVVIATGSRSSVPEPFRALGDRVLTNETVFELPSLPRSLAVIGAGPLGLELAQAFGRLGVEVCVLDEGHAIAGLHEPRAAERAGELIGAELDIRFGVTVSATRTATGASLSWTAADGTAGTREVERVLLAAGRPPRLDGLDLARAGLATGEHGIPDFDRATLRCGNSPVFLAGDANGDRPVLHEASDEGRIAGRNAARYPNVERFERFVPLAITYTDPEIAVIGPADLWRDTTGLAVGEADLARSGRARTVARDAGLIRVAARRDCGRLLGGVMVGPEVEHLAHLLAWCVQLGLTAEQVLALPFYHPTLEESLRSAIRGLCGELRTRSPARQGSLEYGPGG